MPTGGSQWRVNTCFGSNGGGNWHAVTIRSTSLDNRQANSPTLDELVTDENCIQVNLAVTNDSDKVVAVFMQNGQNIRRCGSGTVAAAHVLLEECHYPSGTILQTRCEQLALQRRGELFGYSGKSMPIHESASLPPRLFNLQPLTCYTVGGDHDYLILKFARAEEIRALKPDLRAICQSTQRAIIATAPADRPGVDFVLRYFAPQYSPQEDNATGSANILLGHFWSVLLNKWRLRSQQLSAAGGEFQLEVTSSGISMWQNPMSVTLLAKSHLALQPVGK